MFERSLPVNLQAANAIAGEKVYGPTEVECGYQLAATAAPGCCVCRVSCSRQDTDADAGQSGSEEEENAEVRRRDGRHFEMGLGPGGGFLHRTAAFSTRGGSTGAAVAFTASTIRHMPLRQFVDYHSYYSVP